MRAIIKAIPKEGNAKYILYFKNRKPMFTSNRDTAKRYEQFEAEAIAKALTERFNPLIYSFYSIYLPISIGE